MKLTDGEKLIAIMLADLLQANGVNGEVDPAFVKSAICGGDFWALKWKYHGLFHDEVTDESVADEVGKIMSMCSYVEYSIGELDSGDTAKLTQTGNVFFGFDGNNETDYFGVSEMLVNQMGRFDEFSSRSMNSHMPALAKYRRMKQVYEGVGGPGHGPLSVDNINAILSA